jgi:hypothetical protein
MTVILLASFLVTVWLVVRACEHEDPEDAADPGGTSG